MLFYGFKWCKSQYCTSEAKGVAWGGHDIDRALIEKRFTESVDNLIVYSDLFDEFHVIDNSEEYYRIQFSCYQKRFVLYEPMVVWANKIHQRLHD